LIHLVLLEQVILLILVIMSCYSQEVNAYSFPPSSHNCGAKDQANKNNWLFGSGAIGAALLFIIVFFVAGEGPAL